jgi:hypothetical protein
MVAQHDPNTIWPYLTRDVENDALHHGWILRIEAKSLMKDLKARNGTYGLTGLVCVCLLRRERGQEEQGQA